MKTIDISKPKRMYWDYCNPISDGCPECKKKLVNERHSFLLAVKVKNKTEPFMTGSDAGYFCPDCPVVVLEKEDFTEIAITESGVDKPVFNVIGIVDTDTIPEDKRDDPYSDDNPIPVVYFLPRKHKRAGVTDQNIQPAEPVKKKKIGRNEPCPCGSGKKYKKCCL